jgi:dihydroxyacetone kinase
LIVERAMDAATITSWMHEIEASVRVERDHLVQLDAAIGDGDHGTNMNRGFEAVVQALGADNGSPPGRLLIIAGRTLVSTVGGASGPWATRILEPPRPRSSFARFSEPSHRSPDGAGRAQSALRA